MVDMIVFLGEFALMAYTYFLIGHLSQYYTNTFGWNLHPQRKMALRLFLSYSAAFVCFDIWGTEAMVVLHLAALFVLLDIVNGVLYLLHIKDSSIWRHLYGSGLLVLAVFTCVMIYGSINMNHIVQTNYTITTQKNIRQEGYRIAFLSDIHYGTVQDKAVLQSCISRINDQEPDIVILGGDIVEEGTTKEEMQELFYYLGCLDAPNGIFFVYGNHDRQRDSDARTYTDQELVAAIEANGITILEDETQLINEDLMLIGRADASWEGNTSRADIGKLIPEGQENRFLLTLDHQPLEVEENDTAGVDLMLSGHTHAGQLFPVGYLTELCGKMNYGLYQTGNC